MEKPTNFYKSIFKGTLIFGGVQVLQIFVSLIRGKISAIFLGPEGLGVMSVFTSSLAIFITIFSFGFSSSLVRNLAVEKDIESKRKLISNSIIILFGFSILGAGFTFSLSRFLCLYSFGNYEYVLDFKILSLYVFFSIMSAGFVSVLQGLMYTKDVANVNIMSSLISLLFTIPLIYFFRKKGIKFILIVNPFLLFAFSLFFIKKREYYFNQKYIKEIKKCFLLLFSYGAVVTMAQLLGNLTTYVINIIVTRYGDIKDLGFFNSAMSITNQSVGLIFTAMNIEYSPKLASVSDDYIKFNLLVNQQGVITELLALPILCLMLIFSPFIIKVLLSTEFMEISSVIKVLIVGMFVKAASFSLGYVSFAKGEKKVYLIYEGIIGNIQNVILVAIGYINFGLIGLGYAFIVHYVLYFITIYLICKIRYKLKLDKELVYLTIFGTVALFIVFFLSFCEARFYLMLKYFFVLVIITICIVKLQKKLNLIELIKMKIKKNQK